MRVNIVMVEGSDSLSSSAAPSLRILGSTGKNGLDGDGSSHGPVRRNGREKSGEFEGGDKRSVQESTLRGSSGVQKNVQIFAEY